MCNWKIGTLICGGAHALEGYLDSAIDSRIIKWPSVLHREVVITWPSGQVVCIGRWLEHDQVIKWSA